MWNLYGDFVGITSDPGHVDEGNLGEITVGHDNQGVYSLFSANSDAICVAWVTTQYSDDRGGNQYAVSGDFGRECGGTWYASGMFPSADSQYQPDCFWIDADGDQPNTGFQVRWPSYSNTEFDSGDTDPTKFCNNIDFGLRTESDPNSINYYVINPKTKKRQSPQPAQWMTTQLVVSDSVSHSAKKLCDSAMSLGPDFAHTTEQMFCDMTSKTLYNFCGTGTNGTVCFDLDTKTIATANTRRGAVIPKQSSPYETVRDWRVNQTSAL